MKNFKKMVAIFFSLAMILTFMSVTAFADGNTTAEDGDAVARIGSEYYTSLAAAINDANEMDNAYVELLVDTTINTGSSTSSRFPISKSMTIDGHEHTIAINNRGFGVGMEASGNIDVTFKDVTITNSSSGARCIDTRGNLNSLVLDNTMLSTQGARTGGYTQPLTIGGNQREPAAVNIINNSVIQTNTDATAYYAIITFNPVNMTIDKSTIKGWNCIYAKGANSSAGSGSSTFNITNSNLESWNCYSGTTNASAMLVAEDDNIAFNISGSKLNIHATGDQKQAIATTSSKSTFDNVNVYLGNGNEVKFTEQIAKTAVFNFNYANLSISGGTFTKDPTDYLAEGYVANEDSGIWTVTEAPKVAKIGEVEYATLADAVADVPDGTSTTITMIGDETIIGNAGVKISSTKNIILDLNGHSISNVVKEAKHSQVIENSGTLTIKDETGNGVISNYADEENSGEWWSTPQRNFYTNVITNFGTLTIKSGTLQQTTTTSIAYAVDNNSNTSNAILNIEGGTLTSPGTVVRMFCNSNTTEDEFHMSGGTITTNGSAGLWVQLPGSSNRKATVEVTGGVIKAGNNALYDWSESGNFECAKYNISGGALYGYISTSASTSISGGIFSKVVAKYVAEGYVCTDNTDTQTKDEYPYMVCAINDLPEGAPVYKPAASVNYYWDQNSYNNPTIVEINAIFSSTWLCPGEFIDLIDDGANMYEDAVLNSNAKLSKDGGKLYMSFGNNKLNNNGHTIQIPIGVSIATDVEVDGLYKALGDGKIVRTTAIDTQSINGITYNYVYTAVERTPVAQVGENTYVTLDDAVKAVTGDSGTIMLLDNVDLSQDPITSGGYAAIAPVGKSITLDLNEKTISGGALDVYGTLTTTGNGSVTGLKHGIWVNEGGVLNVQGGTITNTGVGYPIIANPGTVNISGGTVTNENGNGAVYVYNGTLNVTGGTVTSTKDDTSALGVYGNTKAAVSGGTVTGHDWGVVVLGTSELTVSENAVINTANDEGYAICTNGNPGQNATIKITGGTITGNELGVYLPSGKLTVSGGTITGATGIYFKSNSLNITAGTIVGNGTATDYRYNGNGANPTGDALVIDSCGYPNGINDISVSGGNFQSAYAKAVACYTYQSNTPVNSFITGGKYSLEPSSDYVASGYKAANIEDNTYPYQVGEAVVETNIEEQSAEKVDYTVITTVKDTESHDPIETVNNLNVTVTGNEEETGQQGTAGTAIASLSNIGDGKLNGIVESAIEAAGAQITSSTTTASIVIQLNKSAADTTSEGKATYEVHPEAVISVNGEEIGTVELSNSQIKGGFTFRLYARTLGTNVKNVSVTHIHSDGSSEEMGTYPVDSEGYIRLTDVTSFSQFQLEEVTEPTAEYAQFGYTLSLEDNINIVFNVKNLKYDPSDYTVTYTFNETSNTVTLNNKTLNEIPVASCAARQMGDVVNVVVNYNGTEIKNVDLSVKGYCDRVIGNSSNTDLINLCKATLDYGTYAQKTFDYRKGELVNGGKDYYNNENIEVPESSITKTGEMPTGISGVSAALITTSATQLVVYFKMDEGHAASEYTLKIGETPVSTYNVTTDNKIEVIVTGIAAKDLAEKQVVSISGGGNPYTVSISPVDYMRLSVDAGKQADISRAFYNYYLKAAAYFATKLS